MLIRCSNCGTNEDLEGLIAWSMLILGYHICSKCGEKICKEET